MTSQPLTEDPEFFDDNGEPISQRTVQQKNKQQSKIQQLRREMGEETNRSRSSSRRDRRKRVRKTQEDGKNMKTAPLEALEEADANMEHKAMQPFDRIGPDSTSMDGPVTMERAKRGEIPVRGTHPGQEYYLKPEKNAGGGVSAADTNMDIYSKLPRGHFSLIHMSRTERIERQRRFEIVSRGEPRYRD